MNIDSLDHLVLTVRNIETTTTFYTKVLGMKVITFSEGRKALLFGSQKINLHQHGNEFEPKALRPTPGSADVCFITSTPLPDVEKHLSACNITIVDGPVQRTGATGKLLSLYVRDPDANLIEISNRITD